MQARKKEANKEAFGLWCVQTLKPSNRCSYSTGVDVIFDNYLHVEDRIAADAGDQPPGARTTTNCSLTL